MTITRRELLAGAILTIALVCPTPARPPESAGALPVGDGSFEFAPDAGKPRRTLTVWTHRPKTFGPKSPIVFVMHGTNRNGKEYRDAWARHSRDAGFLLLVPEFPEADYPVDAYQLGNLRKANGEPLPEEKWTFAVIERLFDRAKALAGSRAEKYHLYGHSAGGQFVHRFVLFMPDARCARAVAANPGYYTFPSRAAYPYGLKGTPLAGGPDSAAFGRDFVLLLGEADTDRNDPDLRKTPSADAQGRTRFERGQNFFRAATEAARQAHAAFRWRLVTVPKVGHSNEKMAPAAVRELFARHK